MVGWVAEGAAGVLLIIKVATTAATTTPAPAPPGGGAGAGGVAGMDQAVKRTLRRRTTRTATAPAASSSRPAVAAAAIGEPVSGRPPPLLAGEVDGAGLACGAESDGVADGVVGEADALGVADGVAGGVVGTAVKVAETRVVTVAPVLPPRISFCAFFGPVNRNTRPKETASCAVSVTSTVPAASAASQNCPPLVVVVTGLPSASTALPPTVAVALAGLTDSSARGSGWSVAFLMR